jgi:hypothetical protein
LSCLVFSVGPHLSTGSFSSFFAHFLSHSLCFSPSSTLSAQLNSLHSSNSLSFSTTTTPPTPPTPPLNTDRKCLHHTRSHRSCSYSCSFDALNSTMATHIHTHHQNTNHCVQLPLRLQPRMTSKKLNLSFSSIRSPTLFFSTVHSSY